MKIELVGAGDVIVGMYMEGRAGWWEIAYIVEEDAFLAVRGSDYTRLHKAIYPGSMVLVGIPE